MNLQPGVRLGPYEILSPLGAGGMGEVWRAKDTRLDREVAIKILPAGLALNEQFRARFEREAKVISSLNHPNICTLHDVGEVHSPQASGTPAGATGPALHYLVLELVEGESLADRLKKGPLALPDVLRLGAQIADALDAAHRRGIVHRDLKPENVMLSRSGAKLLDFGLARTASEGAGIISGLTSMPTEARQLTAEGTILGTFQYMAPEQLEGLEADARTDIFALGAVLYEMTTGKKAFTGKSKTSLIAAIVSSQPEPISVAMPLTPPLLDHVVRKCLEKDPEDRWQSARDVAGQLRWVSEASSQAGAARVVVASRRIHRKILMAAAICGWIAAAALLAWSWTSRQGEAEVGRPLRAEMVPPSGVELSNVYTGAVVLSPDGKTLAVIGSGSGDRPHLIVRDLLTGEYRSLEGTDGASFPFWSPDSRWIGFFSEGKLRKILGTGGAVQVLCDAHDGRGGSWSPSGVVIFAPDIQGPLMQVPDGGGTPKPVTHIPRDSVTHRNPHFLPDGKNFLFTERETIAEPVGHVAMASLDGGKSLTVVELASNPQFSDGYLFFVRDGNLMAQRMDSTTGKIEGSPSPVTEAVEYFNPRDLGNFTLSSTGDLIYRKRQARKTQLAWIDTGGKEPEPIGDPGFYSAVQLGAGGKRALMRQGTPDGTSSDLWIMDLARGQAVRSTFQSMTGTIQGVLSPDGSLMAVSSSAGAGWGKSSTWLQSPTGGGKQEKVLESSPFFVSDWSPDGRYLIGMIQRTGNGFDVATVDLKGPKKIEIFLGNRFNERAASFSPDGKWLLWVSDESGKPEVFLTDFPAARQKWQVSSGIGTEPFWSPDGLKIFYNTQEGLMSVSLGSSAAPDPGKPTLVLKYDSAHSDLAGPIFATNGKLFLALRYAEAGTPEPLRLIRNWKKTLQE
jgi:eukaryotic-like serine/threonine-protein kinase